MSLLSISTVHRTRKTNCMYEHKVYDTHILWSEDVIHAVVKIHMLTGMEPKVLEHIRTQHMYCIPMYCTYIIPYVPAKIPPMFLGHCKMQHNVKIRAYVHTVCMCE